MLTVRTAECVLELGVAAQPCLRCGDVTRHRIAQRRRYTQVGHVDADKGINIGTTAACISCGRSELVDAAGFVLLVPSKQAESLTIDDLIEVSNPAARSALARLQTRPERLKSGKLLAEDRVDLVISETLRVLAAIGAQGRWPDLWSVVFLVALIGCVVAALRFSMQMNTSAFGDMVAAMIGAGVATGGMFWCVWTRQRRRFRRTHLTVLVAALRPWRPSRADVTTAFVRMKGMGIDTSWYLRERWLIDAMEQFHE